MAARIIRRRRYRLPRNFWFCSGGGADNYSVPIKMKFTIKEFLINSFGFIRQNPTISYSLLLIILLPLVLYFSTFLTVQTLEDAIKTSIKSQAKMNRTTLGVLLSRGFPNKDSLNRELLQQTIDSITAAGNEGNASTTAADNEIAGTDWQKLENIEVVVRDGNGYKTVAAQNSGDVGKTINTDPSLNGDTLIPISWADPNKEYESESEQNGKKYYRIAKPLLDPQTKEIYALILADIPTDAIANQIALAIWQAYAILAAVILLSLFLVFQHTKLFSYVTLSKKLQAQNKAKDDFIRMATHELRSPVTVINAYIEELKDELASTANADQKEYINRISISIKNLADLMADILEVSHIQQGRTDFAPEKIAPGMVVKGIVDGIKHKADEKGLALTLGGADFPHTINVNLICFQRIITNLIENSVKYTPAGKVAVSIKAETSKKRCVITVQDTGFGISAEGQNKLFEQFYRVKTEENAGIPGTGLGLWMSREMARKMGGDIMLESIERMGSRFFVFFPLADK